MNTQPLILGIGGTTRAGSSTEKALLVSLRAAEAMGARTAMMAGPELELPLYAPERPERTDAARKLVDLFRRADGYIFSSPSYHGSISGLIKNALDYTEDLREDERPYLDGRAVGLIAGAAGWQGPGQTLAAMRAIVHALRGWPTPLGAMLNTELKVFGEDGGCIDASAEFQLQTVGRQVVQFALAQRALAGGSLQRRTGT
ncbi:MAG: NAD(P)H-dependent oxidoreductase [Aquisalimonadaceae bacterium]